MFPASLSGQTIAKGRARDLNSIDTPNRKEFLVRQNSREEHSKVIGKGAFGLVVQATYRTTPVAVKLVKREDVAEDKQPNEKNILEISHENIIRIIKIVQESNHFIIIMEKLNGNNLLHILNNTDRMHLKDQLRIIHKVSLGLEYLHKCSIIHLDVKPANILVCPAQGNANQFHLQVKLCDFGNSHRIKAINKSVTLKRLSGTVAFMAPEMLKKNSVSAAADVYALAITIWQLLNRRAPYSTLNNDEQVIYGVVKNNLRPSDEVSVVSVADGSGDWLQGRTAVVEDKKGSGMSLDFPTTEGLTWGNEDELDNSSAINWNVVFPVDQKETPSPVIDSQYKQLFMKCWHRKPKQRPDISAVVSEINEMLMQLNKNP